MSVAVNGVPVNTCQQFFQACNSTDAQRYANDLKKTRLASLDTIQNTEGQTIGTIDATSCIGVSYCTSEGSVYVHHHDGRPLGNLLQLFEEKAFRGHKPVHVTLVGGCRNPNNRGEFIHDYSLLNQEDTRKNFEQIVQFWNSERMNINVNGWAIGDAKTNDTLCSDFITAKNGKVMLMDSGLAVKLNLVPDWPRRKATYLATGDARYVLVYNSSKGHAFDLPDATEARTRCSKLISFIEAFRTDQDLLNHVSTTPALEPLHFVPAMRNLVGFLKTTGPVPPLRLPVPNGPVILLQGEAGMLV